MIDVGATFEKYQGLYGEHEGIESGRRLHARPDLNAFLLLDRLVPGECDMVCSAEHDEIYLDVDPEALARVATEEDIADLVRCGVRFHDDSLCMFASGPHG